MKVYINGFTFKSQPNFRHADEFKYACIYACYKVKCYVQKVF